MQYASSTDSTNTSLYYFYDAMNTGSFEDKWSVLTGTCVYSTNITWEGNASLQCQKDGAANISIVVAQFNDSVTSVYFYDNASQTSTYQNQQGWGTYSGATSQLGVGTKATNTTNYYIWSIGKTAYASNFTRVTGWHEAKFLFNMSGGKMEIQIDNQSIYYNISDAKFPSTAVFFLYSQADMQLYNDLVRVWNYSKYGAFPPQDAVSNNLSVLWAGNTPLNNSYINLGAETTLYYFNYTGTGATSSNCSFFVNGSNNQTQNNLVNDTLYNFSITHAAEYVYNISNFIQCYANNGVWANSTTKNTAWNLSHTYLTSTKLYNRTNSLKTNTSLLEFESWYILVNYTIDGVTPTTSNCNYSTVNISQTFWNNVTGTNTTLTGANTVSLTPVGLEDGAKDDTIIFRGCVESGAGKNIELYFNNVSVRTYSSTLFPACALGTFEAVYTNTTYKDNVTSGVYVFCPSCTSGNNMRITVLNSFNDVMKWSRRFTTYLDGMVYNATTKLFQCSDNHNYLEAGIYSLNISCSNGTAVSTKYQNFTLYVGNTTLYSYLLELYDINGNHSFINGTLLESGGVNITGSCQGNIFSLKQINVTYENGTFIQSVDGNILELNNSVLNADGNYNVSIYCLTDGGNSVKTTKYFTINDSVNPVLSWGTPTSLGTTMVNQYTYGNILLQAYDLNLFSLMVNCSIGFLHLYDFYTENVSGGFIYLNNLTNNNTILGTVTCTAIAKDRHTKSDISDEKISYETTDVLSESKNVVTKDIIFNKGEIGDAEQITISLETFDELKDIKVTQEKDRYTFEPVVGKISNLPQELVYRVRCDYGSYLYYWDDRIYAPEKQKYGKYFGCGDWWIDFHIEGLSEKAYAVTKIEDGKEYLVRISIDTLKSSSSPDDDVGSLSLKSSSIGIKNTVTSTVYYTVTAPAGSSTGGASDLGLLWIGLILIWIALLFCGFLFMQELLVIAGLYGLFVGIALFMAYSWVALVFVALNCLLMIVGFIGNNR
jgi:hypothetical protein